MKAEDNKKQVELNDEQLDNVAGGQHLINYDSEDPINLRQD